jgi:hypothetical protein
VKGWERGQVRLKRGLKTIGKEVWKGYNRNGSKRSETGKKKDRREIADCFVEVEKGKDEIEPFESETDSRKFSARCK